MKKRSEDYLLKAENCAQLARDAADEPTRRHYLRMEAAWRDMAKEQDWLDGEDSSDIQSNGQKKAPSFWGGANSQDS